MFNKVMFSSSRVDWETPKDVYEELDKEFNFDFDPCPIAPLRNKDIDGLKIEWGKCNFVNPPYGREIGEWIKKGFEEWRKGKTIVFLIPSRTDTRWWHDYCMKATEIRFIKGRLKFQGAKNSAPFPSTIIIFKKMEYNEIEMAMDYRQKEKVNVFYNPFGCRLEVIIAKDSRRRSLRLTTDEAQLLIDKLKRLRKLEKLNSK